KSVTAYADGRSPSPVNARDEVAPSGPPSAVQTALTNRLTVAFTRTSCPGKKPDCSARIHVRSASLAGLQTETLPHLPWHIPSFRPSWASRHPPRVACMRTARFFSVHFPDLCVILFSEYCLS